MVKTPSLKLHLKEAPVRLPIPYVIKRILPYIPIPDVLGCITACRRHIPVGANAHPVEGPVAHLVAAYKKFGGMNIDFDQFLANLKYLYQQRGNMKVRMKVADIAINGIPNGEERFKEIFGCMADSIYIEHILPIYSNGHLGISSKILLIFFRLPSKLLSAS